MIVATAGHIDHGKTALVKALTGVDTDRLPQEKARGISIDLGFAYWRTPGGVTVGFVDVPGHERFVRNMLAGVCGIDFALLVVAADDGVMPQTREHLHIIDLLSIRRGIAVISKADRVDAARLEQVETDLRALLLPTVLAGVEVLPVSAVSGQGIETLRGALAETALSLQRESQAGRRFRYAIDRAFTVPGSGTVVTGTVFDGSVAVGDRLLLSPSGQEARVRGIQMHGEVAPHAAAGERCAINLAGVELAQVQRGDWLLHPALHAPTQRMDVRLRVLASEAYGLRHWTPVHLHLGTRDVTARVAMRRGAAIEPGGSALAQLVVDQPAAVLHGDRFILRDQSAQRTVGGGIVLDPWPPRQRREAARRQAQLEALTLPGADDALRALAGCTPGGIDAAAFARSFNLGDAAAAQLLERLDLLPIGKDVVLPRAEVERLRAAIQDALVRFHEASPQSAGIEMAALRAECAPALAAAVFQNLLRSMADEKRIELSGSLVRKPHHVATDNPADLRIWQAVRPALHAAALAGVTVGQLAADIRQKEAVLRDFLQRKAQTGEVIRVTPDRFYLRATMAAFAAIAQDTANAAGGRFTVAQFRDRTGTGRSIAVPVLESLDRLGITQRIGDLRALRQDFLPILGAAQARPVLSRTSNAKS
jgi:selenocysteine-specific elongation factor